MQKEMINELHTNVRICLWSGLSREYRYHCL